MKFYIKYGLGGSFNSCENMNWEEIEAKDWEEAGRYAYEAACEEYEYYAGMYGISSIEEYIEDGMTEFEAYEAFCDERESWIDYQVKN
jgi:hypothetical protein